MSYQNISDEVLAFCYDGPIKLSLAEQVVSKYAKDIAKQAIKAKTRTVIDKLVSQGWIELSGDQETLVITQDGNKVAEEILVKNNMSDFLKF